MLKHTFDAKLVSKERTSPPYGKCVKVYLPDPDEEGFGVCGQTSKLFVAVPVYVASAYADRVAKIGGNGGDSHSDRPSDRSYQSSPIVVDAATERARSPAVNIWAMMAAAAKRAESPAAKWPRRLVLRRSIWDGHAATTVR